MKYFEKTIPGDETAEKIVTEAYQNSDQLSMDDRIKLMLRIDAYGNSSLEVQQVFKSTTAGCFFGALLNGAQAALE